MAAPDAAPPAVPSRIPGGELLSVVSAILLLVTIFALEWYGVVGTPSRSRGSTATSAENGWHGLTALRWLMLLTVIVVLGSVVLHANQSYHGAETDTSLLVAVLGTVTAGLLAYRVLIDLPDPNAVVDAKLGAILGIVSAGGIALGGWESVRERSGRKENIEKRSRPSSAGLVGRIDQR
jgi:hypothetical protein